ncbi:MAG: DUF2520 domain-containing protein [Acidimicrobiales bacterium]
MGPGRAGESFRQALVGQGWHCVGIISRNDSPADAARGADVVLVTVPDDTIASVAAAIAPADAVLIHTSGAKTLDVLAPHDRTGSVHPLISLPGATVGSERLLAGATFAVAGHPTATDIVAALGGHPIAVPDELRATYHAAASVAANHLVAICGQVERLASKAGVPAAAYWEMMALTLENVRASGAKPALTGPASRGDLETIAAHLQAIGEPEEDLYLTLADAAAALAGQDTPISQQLPGRNAH